MSDLNETAVLADEPAGRNPVVLVLAVVGALLAGALVWFFVAAPLLGGGDDATDPVASASDAGDEPATDAAPEAPADVATAGDTTDVVAEEAVLPVVTYEVFLDRDPFDPVVPEPASASADPAADPVDGVDGSVTDGTSGGSTDGATDGATDGSEAPAPDGCTGDAEELVCDGRVVSLVEIRTDDDGELVAVIQVDTTLYEVRAGEIFAGSFRLQSIGEDGVFLLYGDDAFGIDEGERVLK